MATTPNAQADDTIAGLHATIAALRAERDAALGREAALAEVLDVINRSPGDPTPVFEAILEKAHSICGAAIGSLVLYDGTNFRAAATHGWPDSVAALFREPAPPNRPRQSLVDGERFVHVLDIRAFEAGPNSPWDGAARDNTDARTMLLVSLRKDEVLLGFISAFRPEVRAFLDKEIALLESFAAQAVIAMENARLLTEQREALEQQTATAEVLQVINASPGHLAPVFDAMLEKALRLCDATFGMFWQRDGERFYPAALHAVPEAFADHLTRNPLAPSPNSGLGRTARGEPFVHITDIADSDAYRSGDPQRRALVDLGGGRTALWVSLCRDGHVPGVFTIYRKEVRPFTDKQIALLQNFAAQAVIAMENARLITEQREALEQQTATAEVLQVINASPGNLAPVFDAMLEKATRLCDAHSGFLWTYDGERYRAAATRGLPPQFAAFVREPRVPGSETGIARLIQGEPLVHFPDLAATASYVAGDSLHRASVDLGGFRTILIVPLRKDDALLGGFTIDRQEVRPFADKQITLLQNFAAQAVIAMENARLITEQREALEQQTATAEVLQVINASPGDLTPVFEAMLEKAMRLCGAAFGSLYTHDGERFNSAAQRGVPEAYAEFRAKRPPSPHRGAGAQLLKTKRFVHVLDLTQAERYRAGDANVRAMVELGGTRTVLAVPLLKDDALLGFISIYRQEVRAFSDKQIALLENFAAQAVIAMENARLLGDLHQRTSDLQESLEYQTAISDVLKVISGSTFELEPVFQTVAATAARLCHADEAGIYLDRGGEYRWASGYSQSPEYERIEREVSIRPGTGTLVGRVAVEGRPVHVLDAWTDPLYAAKDDARVGGIHTLLGVPLLRDGSPIGVIGLGRRRIEPFTDRQIELVSTFADQAVIAIENTRLLTEQREALEQQTATAEVLQVINANPGNLAPVFDAILQKAHTLCDAALGGLFVYDGEHFRAVATLNYPADYDGSARQPRPPSSRQRELLEGRRVLHVHDLRAVDIPQDQVLAHGLVERAGVRTYLAVPLRKDGVLRGFISAHRREARSFSDKEIALLENFAAQAVIAMENARLLDEIRQRQEELRITFENMGDGVAMFDETPRLVAWNRKFQEFLDVPDEILAERRTYADYIRYLTERGEFGPETDTAVQLHHFQERMREHYAFERTRPDGRVIEVRHNPVPDGGFVLIYTDITERKRSEVEIRAARDAAESAYRDLKAAQANLIQAEKMASLGQLTAGIAHEIKNPLNFVNNFAILSVELLGELKETAAPALAALDDAKRAEVDEVVGILTSNLEKITEHGRRADGIVRSMLEHSRGGSGERRRVDLNTLVEEALNLAYHGARAQDQSFNITLQREFGAGIAPIELVPQDVTRVLLNLFSNGFYAATRRARSETASDYEPTLKVTTRELGDAVEIRVRDNGIGIPAEVRDKLFQPFFTTKPTGEGTGLGLSISYDIVTQQHGGTITVESEPGAYTEFTITIPRVGTLAQA
ncbi:MAG TPA: GAF domain-containing protein [Acetobacteraceae bacterium]|nr:GAF domain-containing protein [Acetobacteraceae bacterium]